MRNYSNTAGPWVFDSLTDNGDGTWDLLTQSDTSDAPSVDFTIQVNAELMLVVANDALNPGTFTVERAFDGTSQGTHASGDAIEHAGVAQDMYRTNALPQFANIGDGTDTPPWVSVPATDAGSGVATPTDDRVSVAPIDIGHDATIVGIGIELTTAGIETSAGSGKVHLFVYDEKNGLPGTALVNQTVDGTVSGDKKVTGLTQVVSPGRYYLGYWTTGWDTTPEIRTNRDLVCQPAYATGMGNTWQAQGVVIATGVTSAPTDGTAQSWFIGNEVFPYVHVQIQP